VTGTPAAGRARRRFLHYDQRGTAEHYIKEGNNAIKWTRLSCRTFAANAIRLQLHVLAYNLDNLMRPLEMPKTAEAWSLTSLRDRLIKIGAKVVSHGRTWRSRWARSRCHVRCSLRPDTDRPIAGAPGVGMTSAALIQAKRRISRFGRRQPAASIALSSR
jgi:hypothetical protein